MASFYKKALDLTPKDHPSRALYMGNLGRALSELATETKSTRKKKHAMDLLLRSAFDPNLPVSVRIQFLVRTARGFLGKDEQRVTECLVKATKLMPILSSRAVAAIDRQFKLSKYPGLASSAAAWLLKTGHPVLEVIEVLEIGRGVILGGYFETRSDLTMLKDLHPVLGHNLEHLQRQLDHDGNGSKTVSILSGSIRGNNKGTFQSRLIQQHEEMLKQIRDLPGFESFLRGPSRKELLQLSQDGPGPLVMLNSHPNRCDAIIVNQGRMHFLPLPSLEFKEIEAYAELIRALPTKGRTQESRGTLQKILNWLWDSIAKPVLENLGFNSTPAEGTPWPKVWWIPTGSLISFPIHAAGRHAVGSQDTVMDRVVSCYTTTIKALDYARKRKEHANRTSQQSMLLVAMSETPGENSLPHALEEVTMVAKMLQKSVPTDVLHQPTKLEVLEGLKKHAMVHFACHGAVNENIPSKSKLLFSDSPLSVEDVVSLRLENVMFAYVSACHSAETRNDTLMDEGLHMAGALQLAGYPQLVATLWPVDDEVSKTVSESIYSSMLADGFGKLAAAEALNNAIRQLRDDSRYVDGVLLGDSDPFDWAPYIYMGA
jgi:CHAT domain-containing protein